MSSLDLMGCKRRKRGERVFKFKTFCENGYPVVLDGAFRQNVKTLLELGHSVGDPGTNFQKWSFQLEVQGQPPFHVILFVIVENVEVCPCKHCQYVGWGQHLICNKKYHFLVPSKDTMESCISYESQRIGGADEGKINFLELQGHTMHGVFHSNGLGHLLCLNGLETGSNLAGHQIMDFWDRLCTGLRARVVSLYDISSKRGMDLRLLHGVAYGTPWFGRWGYKYGRGSYNISQHMYQTAIEALQTMPIGLLITHLSSFNHEIPVIFSRYQCLSDHPLMTLANVLHFMLDLKSQLPKDTSLDTLKHRFVIDISASRWSPKRIEMAIRVIVEALRRAEFKWVSRQEVRDAARAYIGDTGLLDFVLKSLGNRIVGNFLVRRCLNPLTKVLEYCLEDVSNLFPKQENLTVSKLNSKYKATRHQLTKDIIYLYKHILQGKKAVFNTGFFAAVPMAAQMILDTKFFIKDYFGDLPTIPEDSLWMFCTIAVGAEKAHQTSESEEVAKQLPPYESLVLKKASSVDDLRHAAEKTFQEIYWNFRNLAVKPISQINVHGWDSVSRLVEETGTELVLEGCNGQWIVDKKEPKNGHGDRIVDCHCGTKDDDGERMVSCDICEVWQHTRCAQIPNSQQVPTIFLCSKCEQDITLLPSIP